MMKKLKGSIASALTCKPVIYLEKLEKAYLLHHCLKRILPARLDSPFLAGS